MNRNGSSTTTTMQSVSDRSIQARRERLRQLGAWLHARAWMLDLCAPKDLICSSLRRHKGRGNLLGPSLSQLAMRDIQSIVFQ